MHKNTRVALATILVMVATVATITTATTHQAADQLRHHIKIRVDTHPGENLHVNGTPTTSTFFILPDQPLTLEIYRDGALVERRITTPTTSIHITRAPP